MFLFAQTTFAEAIWKHVSTSSDSGLKIEISYTVDKIDDRQFVTGESWVNVTGPQTCSKGTYELIILDPSASNVNVINLMKTQDADCRFTAKLPSLTIAWDYGFNHSNFFRIDGTYQVMIRSRYNATTPSDAAAHILEQAFEKVSANSDNPVFTIKLGL
ncbi:MAG: hypothetical protein A2381_19215 [Bdellovibrionales bacterium RIFOXYB1_FULL_37_110]|nr:MAG: hypothetical protein A2417_04365 [Bdellovibrionales bacterium RIFOXYC1_FULL_37_79]OFZ58662.1 MAG: hypothetical protein A2381_19215 [Bdellovibrionales bacterium RIFOXYB1_FULL_37_110]OFZ63220.1 MAG: hypothetical protein A2577_16870 [Bdellovibrionales bacterium RIFOXYD1_FULL_36_51]